MSRGVSSNWHGSEVSLLDKSYHSSATRSTCASTMYSAASSRGDLLPDDSGSGRMTRWLALATVNVVATSSIANATTAAQRGTRESVALAFASLAFAICTIVGVGRVHEPFRQRITKRPDYGSLMPLTWEQAAALTVLILVCAESAIVLDTRASVSGVPLAVEGVAVWNTNLFCASWIGMYGAAYLVSCVFGHEVFFRNRFGPSSNQLWFLSFFSSLALASVLFSLMSSMRCGQEHLRGSPYCERTLTTAILAFGGSIVSLTCGLCFLIKRSASLRQTPLMKRISLLATAVQFTLFSSIVGLASSPGPAVEFGSVFVASWAAWTIGLISLKTSIEHLFTEEAVEITRTRAVKSLDKSSRSCDFTVRMTDDEMTAFDESSCGEPDETVGEVSTFVRGLNALTSAYQTPVEYTGKPALPDPIQELLSDAESCHRGSEPEDNEDPGHNASYGRSDPDGSSYSPGLLARTSTSTGTTGTSSSSSNPTLNPTASRSNQSPKPHDHHKNSFYTTDGGSYFSGSQAVNVRTGIQEDVSTLGGTTMDRDSRRFGDPHDIRGSHTTASTFGVHKEEPLGSSGSSTRANDSSLPEQSAVKDVPANFSNETHANPKMGRRMSSETFISTLSPLQERSCEESGSSSTGCKTSPATRSGRSTKTSKSPRTTETSKSRSRKSAHVTKKSKKFSNESSITVTVDRKLKKGRDKQAKKDRAAAMAAASNRKSVTPPTASTSSSSSSDFDILIHSDNSEITELTQEGFGPPIAARTTGQSAYIPRSGFASMNRRLPQRLPLYNGSDTSSSAKSSSKKNQQEEKPDIDAFLASAMKYAHESRDRGDFQGSPTTTDDDESVDRRRQIRRQQRRRLSGGVSSSDSGAGDRNPHGIARKKSPASAKSRSQTRSKSSGRSRCSRKSRSSNSLIDSTSFVGSNSNSSRRPSLLSMFSEENTYQIPVGQDFAC